MAALDPAAQNALDDLAMRGPAAPPASFGQIVSADWAAAGESAPASFAQHQQAALDDLTGAYARVAGVDPVAAANAAGIYWPATSLDGMGAVTRRLADRLPDAAQKQIDPYRDVDANAAARAQKVEAEAEDIGARTYGLSGVATGWLAGMARTMVDPLNVAGAVVGAPEIGPLRNWAVREFAVNAGLTAATHPIVTIGREELGLPTTPFWQDVIEGGVSGVALGGVLRAGGWALGRFLPKRAAAADGLGDPSPVSPAEPPGGFALRDTPPSPGASEALSTIEPEDFHAAARWAEARAEAAGAVGATDAPFALQLQAYLDDAKARLEAGDGLQAWHASPHDFDAFSLSAIGSGEGAQAYGAGAYFAESPRTMLHYRRQFGGEDAIAYHVNIDAERHELLDWDRPLAEQPAAVRDAIEQIAGAPAGDAALNARFENAGAWLKARERAIGAPAAAEELRAAGVPGVQYLDAISRRGGRGTHNFVMFDENRVRIVSKNLEPVRRPSERADARAGAPPDAGAQGDAANATAASPDNAARQAAPAKEADRGEASPAAGKEPPSAVAPVKPLSERSAAPALDLNAQRADVERALAEAEGQGGQFKIADTDEAGNAREISARDALREADEFSAAAKEFGDCIGRFGAREAA